MKKVNGTRMNADLADFLPRSSARSAFIRVLCITLWVLASPAYGLPPITAAAFAPNGKSAVLGSQAGVEIRSWPELKPLRRIKTLMGHVHDVEFSPSGKLFVVAGGEPGSDGQIELYRWPDAERLDRRLDHEDLVYGISWSFDGKQLAVASSDRFVTLVDVRRDAKVRLENPRWQLKGHSRSVLATAFLPDGKYVVSAGIDQSLRLWDTSTGRLRRTLDNHTAPVRDLAVRPKTDPSRPMIASASADRTVRLWQPTIGRLVRFARLPVEPLAIAWTPGGDRLLVSCIDGHLRVIDPDTVEVISDQPAIDGWAYTVAASPDGRQALVAGADGRVTSISLDLSR